MNTIKQYRWKRTLLLLILAILYTAAISLVDVKAIGPLGTEVGFSSLNKVVSDAVGVHMLWYSITDGLGTATFVIPGIFVILGIVQWIKRKEIFKVDSAILWLACLYIATACIYVFFEKVIVNYRPILMPGCSSPEASFPSSHTMLSCVIVGSALMLLKDYIHSVSVQKLLKVLLFLLLVVTVIGRLISGVHWLTDILGGVLYSIVLLSAFGSAKNPEK